MLAEGSGPPVLLLHGSGPGTTAAAWAPLIAALAPRFSVLAPDLLGFGESPSPSGSLRAAWTEQASALLDAHGVTSCAVVGNSAGGAIALSLAHARPRRGQAGGRGRLAGPSDDAARRAGRAVGLSAEPRGRARRRRADQPGPRLGRGRRGAPAVPRSPNRTTPSLFPAPRQRWVDDLALSARGAGRDLRAGPADPRDARSHRPAARRRARAARRAARCASTSVRRRRPRHPARTHRRLQPTRDDLSGDRPMTDFAVLRAPSQVLFGAGMAAAAGRVAADHGRRVLVITDPVIASHARLRHGAGVARGARARRLPRRRRGRPALRGRRRRRRGQVASRRT